MTHAAPGTLAARALFAGLGMVLIGGCTTPPPPNIVFIFADDHAPAAIGAYGGRLAALDPTPTIDRLAREGMLFRNTFVTNAICAPSRAVVLTGTHSHVNGVRTNEERFDSSLVTLPVLLRQAGYQTVLVGKWHLKSDPAGFDHWEILPDQGQYYNPDFVTAAGTSRDTGYVTDLLTDKALSWLERGRDPARPFLLMVQHKAPHREWSPDARHLDRYAEAEIPEPPTLFDDWTTRTTGAATQEMTIARHMTLGYDLRFWPNTLAPDDPSNAWAARVRERMTDAQRAAYDRAYGPGNDALRDGKLAGNALVRWKYQRYLKDYLRVIASVDDNLARLLDHLEAAGLARNTVVVYSSDQGFFLGEHGWFDKRWMYEESLRTPLIVRWPGVARAGAASDALVQNLDFAATFLDMAGVPVPPSMQGRSLVPLLRGERPADWRDAIYYHYYEFPGVHAVPRHDGVRTGRYKLIHYYQLGEWELFDLETDPDELRSVHGDPAYTAVRSDLERRLVELRTQYQVPSADLAPVADTAVAR